MSRRLPSAADVRAAVADARRAMRLAAGAPAQVPAWKKAGDGPCAFCGNEGARVSPATKPGLALCEPTVAELHAATRPPRASEDADAVLEAVESWAGPGESAAPEPSGEPCAVCARPPHEVADLVQGPEFSLCADCLASAATAIDPAQRDGALEQEAHAAKLEIEDLERLRLAEGPAVIRNNATVALSLVRLLSAPGDGASALLALIRRL